MRNPISLKNLEQLIIASSEGPNAFDVVLEGGKFLSKNMHEKNKEMAPSRCYASEEDKLPAFSKVPESRMGTPKPSSKVIAKNRKTERLAHQG